MSGAATPSRWQNLLRRAIRWCLWSLATLLAVLALALVAVNLPWVRQRIRLELSTRLSQPLAGSIEITGLDHIGWGSVSGVRGEIDGPSGQRLLSISGAEAAIDVPALLLSWLGGGPLVVRIDHVSLVDLQATLQRTADGEPALLAALAPAAPSEPRTTPPSSDNELRLELPDLRLQHAQLTSVFGDGSVLELGELHAEAASSGQLWSATLHGVQVQGHGLPGIGELSGSLSASLSLPQPSAPHPERRLDARAHWSGLVAGAPVQASLSDASGHLAGHMDARLSGDAWHRILPEAAADGAASLSVDLSGTAEQLEGQANLDSPGGQLHAKAQLRLSPELSLQVSGGVSQLDLDYWASAAPTSALQLSFTAALERGAELTSLQMQLESQNSHVAGRRLPPLSVSAHWEDSAIGDQLRFEIAGPGASLQSGLVRPELPEQTPQVVAWVHASVQQLARWTTDLGLGLPLAGRAEIDAGAVVELGSSPAVSGSLSTELRALRAGPARIDRSRLQLSATGPLTAPLFEFLLRASALRLNEYQVSRLQLSGEGGFQDMQLRGIAHPRQTAPLRLSAELEPTRRSATQIRLRTRGRRPSAHISIDRIALRPGGFEIAGLELRGPGRLRADTSLRNQRLHVRARARAFSPARFLRRLGYRGTIPTGIADLRVRVDYGPDTFSGRIDGVARQLTWDGVKNARLATHLRAIDRKLSGQLALRAPGLGSAVLKTVELQLPRRWDRASLARTRGTLDLLANLNLARLARLPGASSLEELGGRGSVDLRLHWTSSAGKPKLTAALATRNLDWSRQPRCAETPASTPCREPAPFRWQGMDVRLTLDSSSEGLRAAGSLLDRREQPILELHAAVPRTISELLNAGRFDPRALPVDLRAELPARRLADFPQSLRFEKVSGVLRANATAQGTLGQPELHAQAQLRELKVEGSREPPLDVGVELNVQRDQLAASAQVARGPQELLRLISSAELADGSEPARVRRLELEARSNGLPLEPFGALLGHALAGRVYGAWSVSHLGEAPELRGDLRVEEPMFDGVRQRRARWLARADAKSFSSELELDQLAGHALITVHGPWRWDGAFAPVPLLDQLQGRARTRSFELEAVNPLLPEALRALGGQVDADLRLEPEKAAGARLHGQLHWKEGSIYLAPLGQRFHAVTLDASLEPSGLLLLQHLSARAALGQLEATGQAQFEGLRLGTAKLTLDIPKQDPFPLTVQGVNVASIWGRARVTASGAATSAGAPLSELNVAVPRLRIMLPRQAPQDVQNLEPDPTIHKGTYVEPHQFVTLPLPPYVPGQRNAPAEPRAPSPRFEVRLGDDVWVERDGMLEVKVTGAVSIDLGEQTAIAGQLRLPRGVINVQGREFQVERGELTFLEDAPPSNPTLIARAMYEAPDGTRVYAEFFGPVKSGKLTLSSEPPLRDDQILSLLLFGTPEGSFGASTGGSVSSSALAAGGGVVTQGLNAELRRLTTLDIQTRIGQRGGEPQPEVLVQVTPRLSAELGYLVETPDPGQPPDRTQLSLDLRLFKNWSLSTTIGDAGSLILDLLWRYRY